jgi:hypothetical protein
MTQPNRWAGQKHLVEPYIHDYVKFNSNSGWACSADGWCEVSRLLQLSRFDLLACSCVCLKVLLCGGQGSKTLAPETSAQFCQALPFVCHHNKLHQASTCSNIPANSCPTSRKPQSHAFPHNSPTHIPTQHSRSGMAGDAGVEPLLLPQVRGADGAV